MPQSSRKISVADEHTIVERYKNGETTYQIAEDYPITFGGVTHVLKRHGVPRDKWCRRQHSLNESAFDDLSNPDAAYWLGFLFADGSVCESLGRRYLQVRLSAVDCGHLEKLRAFLDSTHKITRSRNKIGYKIGSDVASFAVRSDLLVDRVQSLGLVKGRGPVLSESLAMSPHFWRGCVDGDGTIHWHKPHTAKGRTRRSPVLGLVGPESLLNQFMRFVKTLAPEVAALPRLHPCESMHHVAINGRWAQRTVNALYGAPCTSLDRKAVVASEIIDWKFVRGDAVDG